MADSNEHVAEPPLGDQVGTTIMTVAVKGVLGAVPILGGVLAEAAGQLIPQQRIERIEAYLRYLNERLDRTDEAALRDKLKDAERLDLFEEGAWQSTRALSQERQEYIANVVANGIAGDDRQQIEAKRMLRLLREVDDEQLVILASYLWKNRNNEQFHETHRAVLRPARAVMSADREQLDQATLAEAARQDLIRIGLLAPSFKSFKRGEMPEFDEKTGMIKQGSRKLTSMGQMLLRYAGLASQEDI